MVMGQSHCTSLFQTATLALPSPPTTDPASLTHSSPLPLPQTPQDLQRALYSAIPAPRAQQLGIQLNDFPAEVSRGVQAVLSGAVEQARRVFES